MEEREMGCYNKSKMGRWLCGIHGRAWNGVDMNTGKACTDVSGH
jgi:hypothetical protein